MKYWRRLPSCMTTETKIMNGKLYYKNPYPTRVRNEWLTADMIIRLLFVGFSYDNLPTDIQDAVDAEMFRRHGLKGQRPEVVEAYNRKFAGEQHELN